MPVRELVQSITSFLGLHQGISAATLPRFFSSEESKNVWMDKFARIRKIGGYVKQNSSAVTTDTGASAAALVGLAGYRKTTGGTVSRSLVGVFDDGANEWEIHTSADDGATWTFRDDRGTGPVGKRPSFAQFGDELYIACGGDATPRVWNGTSVSAAGGTQSPQITAVSGAAGNLNGDYEYKLVSIEADGSRHPGSLVSTNVLLKDEKASLSWTADTDMNVVGYEIYRTTGTGLEFYFVTVIDGRLTASHTDDLPDQELLGNRDLREHGDAPPSVYLVEPHRQRMWFGRTDAAPRRIYYSDPNDPDSCWVTNNWLEFDDDRAKGDFLVGMEGGFQGQLIGFLERSVWAVSGTGEIRGFLVDWSVRRTSASVGAVSEKSIIRVPAGAKFVNDQGSVSQTSDVTLAYFTPFGDIRMFNGESDSIISRPVQEILDNFTYGSREKVWAMLDPARSHITWFFPAGSKTYPSDAVTWNYEHGVWYNSPTPASFATGACIETSTNNSLCLVGEAQTSVGGYCYKLWTGNDFDGSNIDGQWVSSPLMGQSEQGGDLMVPDKTFRWIELVVNTPGLDNLTVYWYDGDASLTLATGSQTLTSASSDGFYEGVQFVVTADGSIVTSGDGSPITISGANSRVRIWLLDTNGNHPMSQTIRFKIEDDSTSSAFEIQALHMGYQPLEGYRALTD